MDKFNAVEKYFVTPGIKVSYHPQVFVESLGYFVELSCAPKEGFNNPIAAINWAKNNWNKC